MIPKNQHSCRVSRVSPVISNVGGWGWGRGREGGRGNFEATVLWSHRSGRGLGAVLSRLIWTMLSTHIYDHGMITWVSRISKLTEGDRDGAIWLPIIVAGDQRLAKCTEIYAFPFQTKIGLSSWFSNFFAISNRFSMEFPPKCCVRAHYD